MQKLDLKDAYLRVPLDWNLRRFVKFQWKRTFYEFMSLCIGLGPAPRVFTKKISMSVLRKINIRLIIYFDDMLILSHTIQKAHISLDMVIYLLQNLVFIIDIRKSILYRYQKIEFLGMEIDSIKMILSLTPEKVQKIVKITKSSANLTQWIENLRFCDGLTFSQLNPQMIIQTATSLAGWRAVYNEV